MTMPKNAQTTTQLQLISRFSNVILKILQARLQQDDWIMEKGREFQKNIYFCFIDYAKAFDCVDDNKLENSMDGEAW